MTERMFRTESFIKVTLSCWYNARKEIYASNLTTLTRRITKEYHCQIQILFNLMQCFQ